MDSEELRARLTGVGGSAASVRVPPVDAIRRRLRRRQARRATAGVLACASVAIAAVLVHGAVGAPGSRKQPNNSGPRTAPACASKNIGISWVRSFPVSGNYVEAPPETYLLGFHNNGRVGCTLTGWPELDMTAARPQRSMLPSYDTFNLGHSRVIEPTRVLVRPGATAVSAVTIDLTPAELQCGYTAWRVTPPGPASAASVIHGGPRYVCFDTSVDVSPVYPAGVPISQSYPRSAPTPSPATTISQPRAHAGAVAAPYFVTVDAAKAPAPAEVRSWRTGRITAIIKPPAGSGGFTGVAGAEDDTTFVLAAGHTTSRFYQVSVRNGIASPLVRLRVPPIARPGGPFAVSADGSKLALALPGAHGTAEVVVVDLTDTVTRTWQSPIPGTVTRLSWAGNMRVMLLWNTPTNEVPAAEGSGLRELKTWLVQRHDLLRSRLLIPATVRFGALHGIADPLASPDERLVFATMTSRSSGSARAAVVAFSGTTGRPLRLVTPSTDESGFGTWCGALWTNPAGTDALAACRTQGEWRNGRFTPEQLHFPAPSFSGGGPDFFGW